MAETKDEGGRRPTLSLEPSIRVLLSTRQEGDPSHTMYDDDGSITAFLNWQSENHIYSFRGVSMGPGFYSADFPAEYADAISAYFRGAGLANTAE